MPILTTHALTKSYGSTLALNRLDLELGEGGIFGFLGPNGAGKTTTLRLLLGLLRPTSGHARVFGLDSWSEAARIHREIGYLPGDLRLYAHWSGLLHLKIFGRVRGVDLLRRGRELAGRFDFNLNRRVSDLSRGTRQKLGLILALAHDPRLVILDEPTSGLDPIMQDLLRGHLRDLAARGHTVLFSSHTLSEVEQLCDRVAILRQGKLVEDTSLQELRARAPREVRINWRPGIAPPADPPPGLEVQSREEDAWVCRWHGPAGALAGWLGAAAPEDVIISPPDLENLFHEYYRE